jgi:hypothetical protein
MPASTKPAGSVSPPARSLEGHGPSSPLRETMVRNGSCAVLRPTGCNLSHPAAARRADQPSRPAGHRVAEARTCRDAFGEVAWSATTAGCRSASQRHDLARPRHHPDPQRGFKAFEAWRDAELEHEESEHHKLGCQIAVEEDWLRYGVTARLTRNRRRLAELHALRNRLGAGCHLPERPVPPAPQNRGG